MKAATTKQKNISAIVKSGMDELEELLGVMASCRISLSKTEDEISAHRSAEMPNRKKPKRPASSPAKSGVDKRRKNTNADAISATSLTPSFPEREEETWSGVVSRNVARAQAKVDKQKAVKARQGPQEREKKKAPKRRKTDAIIIKPAQGKKYSDVLKELRSKIKSSTWTALLLRSK